MITLYTAATPNGQKVSIMLEELELPYEVKWIDLPKNEQREPWYVAINPNGRIPAIVDHSADDFVVFESGAIMLYLAEKHGRLLGEGAKGKSLVVQWLMFQMSGVGPMMGQANVFYRYLPEKLQPAIDRFQGESRRLLTVLDARLAKSEYLADSYSIADIANWCWVRLHFWAGIGIADLKNLQRWLSLVGQRAAVQKGASIPEDILPKLQQADGAKEVQSSAAKMVEMGRDKRS